MPISDEHGALLASRLLASFKDIEVLERLCKCGSDALPTLTSLKKTLLEVSGVLEAPEDGSRLVAFMDGNGDE